MYQIYLIVGNGSKILGIIYASLDDAIEALIRADRVAIENKFDCRYGLDKV